MKESYSTSVEDYHVVCFKTIAIIPVALPAVSACRTIFHRRLVLWIPWASSKATSFIGSAFVVQGDVSLLFYGADQDGVTWMPPPPPSSTAKPIPWPEGGSSEDGGSFAEVFWPEKTKSLVKVLPMTTRPQVCWDSKCTNHAVRVVGGWDSWATLICWAYNLLDKKIKTAAMPDSVIMFEPSIIIYALLLLSFKEGKEKL